MCRNPGQSWVVSEFIIQRGLNQLMAATGVLQVIKMWVSRRDLLCPSGVQDSAERSHLATGSKRVGWNSSRLWGLWLTASLPPQYIVLFVAKVLMGQMKEVNDVREYDVEVRKKTATAKKKEAGLQLPSALKEGYVVGVTRVQHRGLGDRGW